MVLNIRVKVQHNQKLFSCQVPINGGWTEWTPWRCPYQCGNSTTTIRTRNCTNPCPLNRGQDCVGHEVEERLTFCDTGVKCPSDCQDDRSEALCQRWSSLGYCEPTNRFYNFVIENCKKACLTCGGSKSL